MSCRLSWNLTGTPRAFYWVQELDPESGAWRSFDSPETATVVRGIRSEPVAAGYLYPVFACNDRSGREDCVSSTVHWVPVMLFDLLIQGLSRAGIDELPEMTEPVDVLATKREETTEVDWIQANVYAACGGEQGRP